MAIFKKDKKKDIELKKAFDKIKSEMTDHLEAINENTSEINSNYEYIMELEKKIAKLSERLDEAYTKIDELSGNNDIDAHIKETIWLNPKEHEVFLLLYSRAGDLIDYREISRQLGLTEEIVRRYVSVIIHKGIPIIKKYFEEKTYLILDADFRNLQAKKNVVRLKE